MFKGNETQEHVNNCNETWEEMGEKKEKCPKFDRIINRQRKDKTKIAKIFKENSKIVEKYHDQNIKIKWK